ncbi:hypothetical protein [Blastococcus sp. TF02A-26]|uniref:hypothetical protein n=1 Tax=Blastococcus sp. TF02A-26 TaxID=2250577 RepID=UPI000DE994F3|nr:hypothetical protein [Blastococcus sp. TF02A-26]RBY84002.1 hypothetical protein DQ240_16255 [Blastococcus sp. TF02A-26]
MTTTRPDDPPLAEQERPDDGAPEQERRPDDPGASAAPARGGRLLRWAAGLVLALLAAVPAVLGLIAVLQERGEPYLPIGDQAFLELNVREVGSGDVLLGAYSRFPWYHPGPMLAYLLAVPFAAVDEAHQGLAVGALVIAGISTVAAVLLVRRRLGVGVALWTLLVLTVTVRLLGDGFLRDSWNPYVPVLPLLVAALLVWTAVRGSAWALVLAVLPMSLAVQAHVGYLPAVGALGGVLAAGLLVRAVRARRSRRRAEPAARNWLRWPVAVLAAIALGIVLWLPPISQQLTGSPGNMGLLLDYFRDGSREAELSMGQALRAVADEFGRVPAYVAGAAPPSRLLLPVGWPVWGIAVGLALFVVALANGVRRRSGDVLWLGATTVALGAAGVAAVARIEGLPFPYVTQWTTVVGVLAWTTVGASLLPELVGAVRYLLGRVRQRVRPDLVVAAPLAVLATVAVVVAGTAVARTETPMTDTTGDIARLEEAIVADLDRTGLAGQDPLVRIDFPGTTRADDLLGTFWPGAGLVLELVRDGIETRVAEFWVAPFGTRYTEGADDADYVVTLAYSDGTSPPPEAWQRVLDVQGELQVYGGVPPTA